MEQKKQLSRVGWHCSDQKKKKKKKELVVGIAWDGPENITMSKFSHLFFFIFGLNK